MPFAAEEANAVGASVYDGTASNLYVAANYLTEADAIAAATAACTAAEGRVCNVVNFVTFRSFTDEVFVYLSSFSVAGFGSNLANAIADCNTNDNRCTATSLTNFGSRQCGDGAAFFDGHNCDAVFPEPTCIGDQTLNDGRNMCVDPTCVGDQTLTDGVCVDPTCIGDQTVVAGVCTDPTCIGDQTVVAGVCTDPTCVAPQVVVMGVCSDPSEMPENETPTTTAATTTDDDAHQTAAFIGGGMVVVGGLVWYLSGGNFALFATTPEFGYSITESGYSANIGGRADFRQDRWHLYWTAGQESVNGDFGDFRYSSGGKWQGDIFAAAFSEKVQGETADYDLSLSANWTGGIWKVSPEFAIDSVYEKGEFATTNSFRINGEMRVDDWHFSASGNQTQMELSAVLEF